MNYKEALSEAMLNKEFISNYDRLSGTNLGVILESIKKSGINLQIDLATGRVEEEIEKFDKFFYEYVWSRLPSDAFEDVLIDNLENIDLTKLKINPVIFKN